MLKKIVLAASAAVVVLGAGTAALAASGSNSPSSAAPSSSAHPSDPGNSAAPGKSAAPDRPGAAGRGKGHRPKLRALGRALHAQWVTRDRDDTNAFVTHDAIRGAVTAVSASSITVRAEDGVSQTYAITGSTKVHLRKGQPGNGQPGNGNGGGAAGTISDVHTGDKVAVTGTGTTSLTAEHIVDRTE
jgi:hypothetical protein